MLPLPRSARPTPCHRSQVPRVQVTCPKCGRKYSTSFPIVRDPNAIQMAFKEHVDARKWRLDSPLDLADKIKITDEVADHDHNPSKSLDELFTKKHWSIENFNKPNLPTFVSRLKEQELFSLRPDGKFHLFMECRLN